MMDSPEPLSISLSNNIGALLGGRSLAFPKLLCLLSACPVERAADAYCRDLCHDTTTVASVAASSTTAVSTTSVSTTTGRDPPDDHSYSSTSGQPAATDGTSSGPEPTQTGGWLDEQPEISEIVVNGGQPLAGTGIFELKVECTDDHHVDQVRFLVDKVPLATVDEPPFVALWPLDLQTQALGKATLRAECHDGHTTPVSSETTVQIPGPGDKSGGSAWDDIIKHPGVDAEALAVAPAPDGSWWICGYVGDDALVMHYDSDGEPLLTQTFHIPGELGRCRAAVVPAEHAREVLLAGNFGTALSPYLWAVHLDENSPSLVAHQAASDATGAVGHDIIVDKHGAVLIVGQLGQEESADAAWYAFADTTLGKPVRYGASEKEGFDTASSVVQTIDDTFLLIGAATRLGQQVPTLAVLKLDAQFAQIVDKNFPYHQLNLSPQSAAGLDAARDAAGNVHLVGRYRPDGNDPTNSRILRMRLYSSGVPSGASLVIEPQLEGADEGRSIAFLSDDSRVQVDLIQTNAPHRELQIRRFNPDSVTLWHQAFQAGPSHEPRAVGVNAFDQILVVGFEEVYDQDNTMYRQILLRAFNG